MPRKGEAADFPDLKQNPGPATCTAHTSPRPHSGVCSESWDKGSAPSAASRTLFLTLAVWLWATSFPSASFGCLSVQEARDSTHRQGGGMALNVIPLPGAQHAVWSRGGTAPVPAAILTPREGEQDMEERQPGRRRSGVGKKPGRRQTDGRGLWATEAGRGQQL